MDTDVVAHLKTRLMLQYPNTIEADSITAQFNIESYTSEDDMCFGEINLANSITMQQGGQCHRVFALIAPIGLEVALTTTSLLTYATGRR